MLWMAIITPTVGAFYLVLQIHKRDLRGWQHYACLTSLFFLISILFLVASGKVESFGLAGNTVKVVDQKLEEIKALTEQNKQIAKASVSLILGTTSGLVAFEQADTEAFSKRAASLLKEAGLSESEIQKFLQDIKAPGVVNSSTKR